MNALGPAIDGIRNPNSTDCLYPSSARFSLRVSGSNSCLPQRVAAQCLMSDSLASRESASATHLHIAERDHMRLKVLPARIDSRHHWGNHGAGYQSY